jgi:predicted Rossmann-fold nucleotide-binding protein
MCGEAVSTSSPSCRTSWRPLPTAHRTIRVADLQARKATMYAMANAFVALPGGIGTPAEFLKSSPGASSAATICRSRV